MHDVESVLSQVESLVRGGRTDSLLRGLTVEDEFGRRQRQPGSALREPIRELAQDTSISEAQRLQAQARSAQLEMLMRQKRRAAAVLWPYVELVDDHRIRVMEMELKELLDWKQHAFLRGQVLGQVANILHLFFDYERGCELARRADALMGRGDASRSARDVLLAVCENRIWWARLLFSSRKFVEAEALLKEVIRDLTSEMAKAEGEEDAGGLDLLAALAFDLWSSFDLRSGKVNPGLRKIYKSLYMLRGGRVQNAVRLAHSHYMAARLELSSSASSMPWTIYLFDESIRIFEELDHPFRLRAMVQKAQALSRGHRISDAEKLLVEVGAIVDSPPDHIAPDEIDYIRADLKLAEVWILEHQARQGNGGWERCRESARELDRMKDKPVRLKSEGRLHYALALVHLPDFLERGRVLLAECIEEARIHGKQKIEAAGHLALAESYMGSDGGAVEAHRHLDSALRILKTVRSSFLHHWSQRLIIDPVDVPTVGVSLEQSLEGAVYDLHRKFLAYHMQMTPARADLWSKIGISPAKGYRLLERYKLKD